MRFVSNAVGSFLGLIFPSRCLICEAPLHPMRECPLCPEHLRQIRVVEPPVCSRCGRKMSGKSVEALVCAECRSRTTYHDSGYSACAFADPLRELIHLFKYRKKRYLASFLARLLVDYLREHPDISGYDAIIPVPLHWRRRWTRGFNQALDLARPLSKHFGIPVMKGNLRRVRYTKPQVRLVSKERESNIRNAFRTRSPTQLAGKRLILLDDVITSGATLNECSRVLKRAGASWVAIVTLAQASGSWVLPEPQALSGALLA